MGNCQSSLGDLSHLNGPYTDADVGSRLRAVRKQRRLTLAEIETISLGEFRTSVLGAYERGERGISVKRLLRLADIYGMPAADLLPKSGPDGDQDRVSPPRYPPDAVL